MDEWESQSIFCVIQGNDALFDYLQVQTVDQGIIELISVPILWEQVIKVKKGALVLRRDDAGMSIRIRMSYLLYLWNNYVLDNDTDEISYIVKKLLGTIPIHYTVFDKWWILSRPLHETSSEIEIEVSHETLENFAKPDTESSAIWFENLPSSKTND